MRRSGVLRHPEVVPELGQQTLIDATPVIDLVETNHKHLAAPLQSLFGPIVGHVGDIHLTGIDVGGIGINPDVPVVAERVHLHLEVQLGRIVQREVRQRYLLFGKDLSTAPHEVPRGIALLHQHAAILVAQGEAAGHLVQLSDPVVGQLQTELQGILRGIDKSLGTHQGDDFARPLQPFLGCDISLRVTKDVQNALVGDSLTCIVGQCLEVVAAIVRCAAQTFQFVLVADDLQAPGCQQERIGL